MKKTICMIAVAALLLFACFGCGGKDTTPPDIKDPPGGDIETPVELPDKAPVLWSLDDVDVSHIGSGHKLIAFTFDDGLGFNTPELLDAFETFNAANPDFEAHATLFMNGKNIKGEGDGAKVTRAVKMGMELGNHTENHISLKGLTPEKIVREVKTTDDALKGYDNKEKHLVRPPFGDYDDNVLAYVKTPLIMWTDGLDTSDWDDKTSIDHIHDTIYDNRVDGGIAIMHQGHAHTIPAVTQLLGELKADNYQVVSVSELAKAKNLQMYSGTVRRKLNA